MSQSVVDAAVMGIGTSVDRVIQQAAGLNHGVTSRTQLRAAGLTDRTIDRRIERGVLHPVFEGVYAVGRPDLSLDGRRSAVVRSLGQLAWLSYRSAAATYEIHFDRLPGWDVTILRGRGGVAPRADVRIHHLRTMAPGDVITVRGIPITTPSRTLVDLAQVLPQDALRRAVHEAEVKRLLNRREVSSILERMPTRRGAKRLADLLGTTVADPTNSEFVARYMRFAERFDLHVPETSVHVDAGFPKPTEIDLLYRRERVIIELDGKQVHLTAQRFESDRRRDSALLARGFLTIRITWNRLLHDQERLAEEIRAILLSRASLAA